MSFSERYNFNTSLWNGEISKKGKTNSISTDNKLTFDKFRQQLFLDKHFAGYPSISEKETVQSSVLKQNLQLNSSDSQFSQMQNAATVEKSKKRLYSKPCPKSRKKIRMQSPGFNEDEKILDNDLLGLAESINTDKSLDSDSSNDVFEISDTIIVDDNSPFEPSSKLNSDTNLFKEQNTPASSFFNNSLHVSTDGSKHRTFTVEKKKGVKLKSGVVFREVLPSSFSRNTPSPTSSILHSNSLLTKSNDKGFLKNPKGAKKKTSQSLEDNTSKIENTMKSPISNLSASSVCQSNRNSNPQSIYASMGLDEDLCDTEQASNKIPNSVSRDIELTFSPEKLDSLSKQASCRISNSVSRNIELTLSPEKLDNLSKQASSRISNSVSRNIELTSSPEKLNNLSKQVSSRISNSDSRNIELAFSPVKLDNYSEVKIKTEPDEYYEDKSNKNENVTLDGYHVSMTFEAESSCDDDEDDDIPLSLLRNQKSADQINMQIKSESLDLIHKKTISSDKTNTPIFSNINDFPHPPLIKRELIEDEIVSEGQAVSSINLSPISSVKDSPSTILSPFKIKSEPVDEECFSENLIKTNSSTSLGPFNSQLFASNSTRFSAKSPEKNKQSSVSKATDLANQNSILVKLLQNKNSLLTLVTNTNKDDSFNIIAEKGNCSVLNTDSSLTESLHSAKPVTIKSAKPITKKSAKPATKKSAKVSKKKKTVKKKAANVENFGNSFAQPFPHSILSEISPTVDNVNSSNESTSNNSDFNAIPSNINCEKVTANDLNAPSSKILDSTETVTKKPIKNKRPVKKKIKGISKEPSIDYLSQSVSSEISAEDNKTLEIEKKCATDSDTSVLDNENQMNPPKKGKRKRGTIGKKLNIDENLPITLLIKRQKSDTDVNSSDSFLCTNLTSKSPVMESHSVHDDMQENNFGQFQENSSKTNTDSNILSPEINNIPQNTKKKKTGKKKVSKKKAKQSALANTESEVIPTDVSFSTSFKEPESNIVLEDEHFNEKKKEHSVISNSTFQGKSSAKNVKGKNKSLFSVSTTVEDSSSQDNQCAALSFCDTLSEKSLSSLSLQASVTEDINSQSEMNNLNSTIEPPKKKKRRSRTYGWYKKKKTKKDKKRSKKKQTPADSVDIENPVSETIKDPLLLTIKTPVVVIKNLNSNMKNVEKNYVVSNASDSQSAEKNCTRIISESLENSPATSFTKGKKSKKNKSGKKVQSQVLLENNDFLNDDEDTLTSFACDNVSDETCSSKEIVNESNINNSNEIDLTVENTSGCNEVTICEPRNSSVDSATISNERRTLLPSLNVLELAKDIAAFEALIQNQANRDTNRSSLVQNTPRSDLKTVEQQNADKPVTLVKDTNKNLSDPVVERLYVKPLNAGSALNNANCFQSSSSIHVKKELNDNSDNQPRQNSLQRNHFRTTLCDKESSNDETGHNSISPLVSIKKEKDIESLSLHKNSTLESCASNRDGQTDRLDNQPIGNADKINSTPNSENNLSLNIFQKSLVSSVNSIGLTIKKEATDTMKSTTHFHSFRDQDDLIQQVGATTSKSFSTNLPITKSKRNSSRYLPDTQLEPDPVPEADMQKKSLELLNDDEIQIIPKENTLKNVDFIDLTDDSPSGLEQKKIPEYETLTNILSSEFIELSKRIKIEKDHSSSIIPETSKEIVQTSDSTKQISTFSFCESDHIQSSLDPSKVRTNVSDQSCVSTGDYVSEDPIQRETSNPFIVRDKYIDEYFKYPFPSSVACNKKPRTKSKMYERIDSKTWNLSIEEVESRLKLSESTVPQFGKKLGDVVKLEKYPVSKSEVECYHRILGVAPTHNLSLFKSKPNKRFITSLNNEFNKLEQSEFGNKKTKDTSYLNCTADDILQGITESKMMSRNLDSEKDITSFDRDCPSTETRDSFDSCVSHLTDKFVSPVPDKDIEQPNLVSLKRNQINSPLENAFSTSQNSSLSFVSNVEDVSNNAVSVDTFINKPNSEVDSVTKSNEIQSLPFLQSNILANLTLPSKEEVNKLLNCTGTSHSTTFETPSIVPNSYAESVNVTVNNESPLPSNYSHLALGVSSEVSTNVSQSLTTTSKIVDIINLPVLELRKILETASSLQSASNDSNPLDSENANNVILPSNDSNQSSLQSDNHDGIWKNKETFEYNHTQSIPLTNADSDKNTEIQKDDRPSESIKDTAKEGNNDNSDDEYVDNEPIHYDSDTEKNDSSSHEDEERPIPQYKSKWEKIMERKSQELKEKQKINTLYLEDCVPVSSRINLQSKKNITCNKVSQSTNEKLETPDGKAKSKVQKSKSAGNKSKKIGTKNKTETKVEKINKSPKKTGKQNSKTNKAEGTKKESPLKKNKSKKAKDAPNLFAPDKLVKVPPVKKSVASTKSDDNNKSKRFYGNRVTNRGTFLTESNPTTSLTKVKVPKKITSEITKKPANVRSEEIHSMIKSPVININLPRVSSYKNVNRSLDTRKNSEEYRSPLANTSPTVTSHFIRTKRMRDRQNAYLNPHAHFTGKNDFYKKKPLLPTPYSEPTPYPEIDPMYLDEEIVPNRSPLLNTPQSNPHHDNEIPVGQKIPVLTPNHHYLSENSTGQKIPVLISSTSDASQLPSDSFQSNGDSMTAFLKNVLSVVQNKTNATSQIQDNIPSNTGNMDTTWSNNQYNSSYAVADSPVTPSINPQPNFPLSSVESVNNPFRNTPQFGSLNLQNPAVGSQLNNNLPFNSVVPAAVGSQINNLPFNSVVAAAVASQINNNLTFNSVMPVTSSMANSLDPRRASFGLQSNLLSNPISNSNSVSDALDPRRAALGLQPNMSIGISSASPLDPRRITLESQPNMPVAPLTPMAPTLINIPLSESLDPRKAALINQTSGSKKHLDSQLNAGSQLLNSPPYITPMNSASQQASRKAICLVPSHLKSLVGHETIETYNVRLLMLEWSVDWLIQQQKNEAPPPISQSLKKVTSSYDSFEDYYNTYFPLMLLETWHRIYVSWTHLNQTAPFLCQITSYSVKTHYVSVECQTVFSTDYRRKGVFPDDGSILMVKYSTKNNEYTMKILGYVTNVKTRRYNPVTDSKLCSSLPQQKDVNPDSLQILTLTFMGAYNSEDIDKHQPVRIHVLCTVKHNLKQNDAMLYINKSPLQRSILNPVADGLLTFSLTPRNSPEEKINECVRDITKGILSPHPLPLLTIVRAKPESDRLNIIPLLVQKMKTAYKTKVLLCVRTVRALGDIAANICLQQSLKLVIINKRCDTNLQFQKYLLDELVACEMKKLEEGNLGEKCFKTDKCVKIKKQIIKDCDVILSLIRNSHDDFLNETFIETESIPQMCCIVDEANLCTEPETLIPILHGISKLILIGDPDYTAKVLSKRASAYDFNQSFFQRAYDLDLLTE